MEIFQPFGSEAWPSSQRDGVCQGQEVVVEGSAWSADGEGTIVVAQRLDLRGKWSMRPAARAGPCRRPQWRPSLSSPSEVRGGGSKDCGWAVKGVKRASGVYAHLAIQLLAHV